MIFTCNFFWFTAKEFTIQGNFTIAVTGYNITEFENRKHVVIPAWLMIVEKNIDQGSAILAKWFITADLLNQKAAQAAARGSFNFSLPELLPIMNIDPLDSNDYCCYLVINGHIFGPEKCVITN